MKTFTFAILLGLALQTFSHAGEARFFRVLGPVPGTITACNADGYVTWTNAPTNATFTVQTARSLADPSDWADYVQVPVTNPVTTHRLFDLNPPSGMVFIPAGSFRMGDTFDEGLSDEVTNQAVYVSAFCMDKYEVTKVLWDEVYLWAITNGYSFDNVGSCKATNHPVQTMNWYDIAKWCNARSEKEGLAPAYYTEVAQTNVYRTGTSGLQNDWANWTTGYRLPTEAEWEKAARGGPAGHRFPWSDVDIISHSRANYYANATGYAYDVGPLPGFHPTNATGEMPYTSPVGSFPSSGYGMYDMAGNLAEWCWDWYDASYYSYLPVTDPRGPIGPLSDRVLRGGSWGHYAFYLRCAARFHFNPASTGYGGAGFRCVRVQ